MTPLPGTMKAVALDRFGGPERLQLRELPLPGCGPGEVLIRVDYAAVGEWDPFEREGGYAELLGMQPRFPYVLGSEGAGVVVAVGEDVSRFRVGEAVYALGFLNPKGGFYAEYAAVPADFVSPLPAGLTAEAAAGLGGVGITALRGLEEELALQPGHSVLIHGASGGVGHVAVQLARRLGARVLAVASGDDGVALVKRLGAEAAIDGRREDVAAAARAFAPAGLDGALLNAGGEAAEQALSAVRPGGRAAYPNGIDPVPAAPAGVRLAGFNGEPDPRVIARLDALVAQGPFEVHVSRTLPLAEAAEAHRAVKRHHLGKLVLRVR